MSVEGKNMLGVVPEGNIFENFHPTVHTLPIPYTFDKHVMFWLAKWFVKSRQF